MKKKILKWCYKQVLKDLNKQLNSAKSFGNYSEALDDVTCLKNRLKKL